MKSYLSIVAFIVVTLVSCKKDDVPENNNPGRLSVEFDNIVDGQNLFLNTVTYTNSSGENYKVTTLKYYISNIKVTNTAGAEIVVPQDSSYFLIDESDAASHSAEVTVPKGDYKQITFTVGVDSLRNTMDVASRTGVLDPAAGGNGMYWSWNSGYIFFKIEGTSPASAEAGNAFMYHIGGFGGYSSPTINNIREVTLDLTAGGIAKVAADGESNIHLMVDIAKLFNGSTQLSIAANPVVMFGDFSGNIANNYSAIFRHDHTEN